MARPVSVRAVSDAEWRGYLRFREAIAGAVDPRFHPIGWVDDQVLRGHFRVWAGDDALILAGIRRYPSLAADVEGLVAAGDAAEIVERLIPQAETWGRAQGCAGARIDSREGWERLLRPHGWRRFQTTIRKTL